MKRSIQRNFIIHSFALIILLLVSCKEENKEPSKEKVEKKDQAIEIITERMDFQTVDSIPSGWTTFKYINISDEPHFFLLDKYPEGRTIEDGEHEIIPVFQKGMDLINAGKSEEGFAEFGKLPEWFSEIVFTGGSGLISPKGSSLITVKMEPGYYVMECYVKMANGKFHSSMGMAKEFIVTSNKNNNKAPESDIKITLSSTKGFVFDKPIPKGKHTFSVHFEDQIVHENFVGHDLNLVKLEDGVDLETLESWMNWANPKGLINPAPEGVTFLGGINEMPAGSTAYFHINLKPGKYAFVSEVPNTISKNMLVPFEVPQ